jgi:aminoglycoside/choline kinase family phosphotransferase
VGDVTSHVGVSADYLAQCLGVSELKVESIRPIGTGQMAESYRVTFVQRTHGRIPRSVVVKVPSQSESSRAASRITRCYELETGFYTHVQSLVQVSAPTCLHVWFDAHNDDFVLVLEDIVDGKQGDQLAGATVDQARAAIDELVRLHSPLWNSSRLDTLSWMPRHTMESSRGTRDLLRSVFSGFVTRFSSQVSAEVLELGNLLVQNIDGYDLAFPNNETIVHRDFRLDNLLFTESANGTNVIVVDWQTVSISAGVTDLAYFIGASFSPEQRRKVEEELVHRYHDGLLQAGISMSWIEVWNQYRLFATSGYIMAIIASMLVKQTERGDAMFAAMANRHGQQMIDLETLSLIR